MESLLYDLRYGLRVLRRSPLVTAAAVIALALGIGANTAIFSLVNAVVIRPLPYERPDELVLLGYARSEAAPANYLDWKAQATTFKGMAALSFWSANLSGDGQPERYQAFLVDPDLFPVLGVRPAVGRGFLREEADPGRDKVVVLSHGLWQRRFGGDAGVVGRSINVNAESYTVVGVMPPDFEFYRPADLWAPLAFAPQEAARRAPGNLIVAARLKPGASLAQAQEEMNVISRQLAQLYPQTNNSPPVRIVTLHESITGGTRRALLVLLGAVVFVLLIACVNVASILLARATTRRKEMAVRAALGAGRARIVRQLLTESVLLSLLGGALGLLLAWWLVKLLVVSIPPTGSNPLPRSGEIGIDATVLLFTLLISVVTGIVFGLAPALQTSDPRLGETLKESGRGSGAGSTKGRRLRSLFVVVEVAMSLVLLIGAGLMIKSFLRLLQVDTGFKPQHVLTMQTSLLQSRYATDAQVANFYKQALEKLRALPGAQAVGATSHLPLGGGNRSRVFEIEGRPQPAGQDNVGAGMRITTPDYFPALGIPLTKGRLYAERDDEKAPGVAVINEAMARRYFQGEDPVGKRLRRMGGGGQPPPWLEIVGVVGDVRHSSVDAGATPEVYVPLLQNPERGMTFVIRTAADPRALAEPARAQVLAVDKDQPVFNIKPMEQVVDESVFINRFSMYLIGLFAALALALAAVGIYSVMSYSVTQRTHEIGVRMALGARPGNILVMVLKQGMLLTLFGVLAGLAAAFGVTRYISSLLYGVSEYDLATFGLTALLLAVVALFSTYFPARQATKVDPLVALRYE
ncbi:MAG TPA: ABC transporter permease [Pyrinomonadaceae bacterium]|jgi:putative ABC transport system permease protein